MWKPKDRVVIVATDDHATVVKVNYIHGEKGDLWAEPQVVVAIDGAPDGMTSDVNAAALVAEDENNNQSEEQ